MDAESPKHARALPLLIMVTVTLPFVLLAWLLIDAMVGEMQRHQRIAQTLLLFESGLQFIEPLEQVRDLATARFHSSGDVIAERHQQALQAMDRQLPLFIDDLRRRGGVGVDDQISSLLSARQVLDDQPVNAGFMVMFDASAMLADRTWQTLAAGLYLSDMVIGEPVTANEYLIMLFDKVRSARHNAGLLRSLSLHASLGSGYLASGDAGRFDLAWGGLHDDLLSLDRQIRTMVDRGHPESGFAPIRESLSQAWGYLEKMAEQVLVSDRVEMYWGDADESGEQALGALHQISLELLSMSRMVLDEARVSNLRFHLLLLFGMVVVYLLLVGFALMLYRSRYEILKAQTESRTKSQFLARMSHEIRTPLNGVIGLAELLRDTSPTPRQHQYIELIENSGRSLVALVNDILDHARIEAGKLELEQLDFDLTELVSECAHIFSLRAQDNDTIIYWHLADDVPAKVVGDPARLRQVLMNLLSNAVKFTEHGVVEVGLSLVARREDAWRLRFEVKDSGIGLSPAEQEQLFHLFSQASPSVSRRYGGSGLGLSISRELVRLMGGDIGVRSARHWGSTFFFELDFRPSLEPHPPARAARITTLEGAVLYDLSGQLKKLLRASEHYRGIQYVDDIHGVRGLFAECRVLIVHAQLFTPLVMSRLGQLMDLVRSLEGESSAASPMVRLITGVRGGVDMEKVKRAGVVDIETCTVFDDARLEQLLSSQWVSREPARTVSATEPPEVATQGLRVLVAEDNPVNQIVTDGMLKRLGVSARMVADGWEAVKVYEASEGGFDLILMDLDMPVMDGTTASKEIRAVESRYGWPKCKIVALSAHGVNEYRQAVRDAGMDGQLIKPVTLAELGSVLS